MMKEIDARLPTFEMRRGNPFCAAVFALAGLPATRLNNRVMAAAAEGQIVDVGRVADGVIRDMVDLAEIAGGIASGMRAPTILRIQHNSLPRRSQSLRVV